MAHSFDRVIVGGKATAFLGDRIGTYNKTNITLQLPSKQGSPSGSGLLDALWRANNSLVNDERKRLRWDKGDMALGTCEWILEDKRYVVWKAAPSQILRISGGPGRGKTMLSMFLTEHHEQCSSSDDSLSLHYFCQAGDERCNSALAILQGLTSRLLVKLPQLEARVRRFEAMGERLASSFEALWSSFQELIEDRTLPHVRCVIDGFDECEGSQMHQLLSYFIEVCNRVPKRSQLSLLLVGRDVSKHGLDVLLSNHTTCVSLDEDPDARRHLEHDLGIFVNAKINALMDANRDKDLCQRVRKSLTAKSGGTFLWVGYVCQEVLKRPESEIEDALESLPPGLEDLYLRILSQIPLKQRAIAARVIQWVAVAVRPLQTSELADALDLARESNFHGDAAAKLESYVKSWGHVLQISQGFTVPRDNNKLSSSQAKVVRFPHQSVRDFLASQQNQEFAAFQLLGGRAHGMVAERLLDQLEDPPTTSLRHYAASYWYEHVRASSEINSRTFDRSRSFFKTTSQAREVWWEGYCSSPGLLGWDYGSKPPRLSGFQIACHLGLVSLVKKYLSSKVKIDECFQKDPSFRSGLMWAIQQPKSRALSDFTNDQVVELLVDAGANVNFCDTKGRTPLDLVIRNASNIPNVTQMMQVLVTAGAAMSARDELGRTPLHSAARFGCEEAVKFLIERRVQVDARRDNLETPLLESVVSNNIKCAAMLIEAKADVNATDDRGRTPLIEASAKNEPGMAIYLVKEGAIVNFAAHDKTTPLHIAALRGCREIVKLLIDSDAHAEAQDSKGNTPVYYAERSGRDDILKIFHAAEQSSFGSASSSMSSDLGG